VTIQSDKRTKALPILRTKRKRTTTFYFRHKYISKYNLLSGCRHDNLSRSWSLLIETWRRRA